MMAGRGRRNPERSDAQSLIEAVKAEWVRYGLSTARADRPAAATGINNAYAAAGLDAPQSIVWVDNPHSGAWLAAALMQLHETGGTRVSGEAVTELLPPTIHAPLPVVLPTPGAPVYGPVIGLTRQRLTEVMWERAPDIAHLMVQVFDVCDDWIGTDGTDWRDIDVVDQLGTRLRRSVRESARSEGVLVKLWGEIWASHWPRVRDQVRDERRVWQLEHGNETFRDADSWSVAWSSIEESVKGNVRDWVEDQITGWGTLSATRVQWMSAALARFAVTVRALMTAAFAAHPRAATAARVKRTVSECGSQHDIEALGRLDCLSRLGLAEASAAGGLLALGRSCGWWWLFTNVAICSERPSEVRTPRPGEPLDGNFGARYGSSFKYIEVLVSPAP